MTDIDVRRHLPIHLTWMLGFATVWVTWLVHEQVPLGADAHAYWAAWRGDMYDQAPSTLDAYLYSPAFAQVLWPLIQLPWPFFGILWAILTVGALTYLLVPLGWRWVAPLLLLCAPEIASGNVFWLLAVVAALGLRHPSLWTFAVLTKVTPALGPIWFALRREWRNLAISAFTTIAVVTVSFMISPDLWRQWVAFLLDNASSSNTRVGALAVPPLTVRLPVALCLLVITALTDRPWGLPAAMVLVTPVGGIAALTILAAIPRLSANQADTARDSALLPVEQTDQDSSR